jgi:hypothetical protein
LFFLDSEKNKQKIFWLPVISTRSLDLNFVASNVKWFLHRNNVSLFSGMASFNNPLALGSWGVTSFNNLTLGSWGVTSFDNVTLGSWGVTSFNNVTLGSLRSDIF